MAHLFNSAEQKLNEYKSFIINCTSSPNSANNYTDFSRLEVLTKNRFPDFPGFLHCDDPVILQSIYDELSKVPSFSEFDDNKSNKGKSFKQVGGGQYHNTLLTYIRFLKAALLFRGTTEYHSESDISKALQIIYFGAPGTGKSHAIEVATEGQDVIRTTFHPDTDYSSFVGCYKPMQDEDDPKKIIYKFEGQCFAKAYVEAWKRFAARKEGQNINYTLIIEEINRGNCAQIFGDIFQLLDRDENGFSQYGIVPDEDLAKYLLDEFNNIQENLIEQGFEKIALGEEMKLPPNLSIIATMNTSDQSLFPIDSAFKRRWDWEYIPIQYEPLDKDGNPIANKIDIDGTTYDWGEFIKEVNGRILKLTRSEDKQLGYFFVRPDNGKNITMQRFVSKVMFYLWSDIYKDYAGRNDSIFKIDGKDVSFNQFFENGKIDDKLVNKFIQQLGVHPIEIIDEAQDDLKAVQEESKQGKKLIVKFPDGTTFESDSNFDTYKDAIIKIGVEKVEPIAAAKPYQRRNCPLISKEQMQPIIDDPTYNYIEIQGYQVVRGAKTQTLAAFLKHISSVLSLNLEVIYQ